MKVYGRYERNALLIGVNEAKNTIHISVGYGFHYICCEIRGVENKGIFSVTKSKLFDTREFYNVMSTGIPNKYI